MKIVGRLNALQAGRAVRAATHLQVIIQPHALIICPLAMAGEDTTIHAIAVGGIGAAPEIRVAADPRVRDEQYALVAWLGGIIEAYYQRCRDSADFPQIWVSSGAAAGHLDILADRLRFTRENEPIKRMGELLTYATERGPVTGQQALVTATGALAAHFATGQQEGEDEHLGVFLTWLAPPPDQDIRRAIELAEHEVMGVKTDPIFDRNQLAPLVAAFNKARAEHARPEEMRYRTNAISSALTPVVARIYDAVQRAISYLNGQFPPAAILADLARSEAGAFASFMNGRDLGLPLPYRDTPKAGVFKITERETAAQNLEAGSLYGDTMLLAKARMEGRVLSGIAQNVTATKVPYNTVHRSEVVTGQGNLHLRRGDVFAQLDNPGFKWTVEHVARNGAQTSVTLSMRKRVKGAGPLANGQAVEFAPPPPDWTRLGRSRSKMQARLAVMPWTHGETPPVQQAPSAVPKPTDLLAAVEALR